MPRVCLTLLLLSTLLLVLTLGAWARSYVYRDTISKETEGTRRLAHRYLAVHGRVFIGHVHNRGSRGWQFNAAPLSELVSQFPDDWPQHRLVGFGFSSGHTILGEPFWEIMFPHWVFAVMYAIYPYLRFRRWFLGEPLTEEPPEDSSDTEASVDG